MPARILDHKQGTFENGKSEARHIHAQDRFSSKGGDCIAEFLVEADLTITGRRVIGCLMGKGTNGARACDLALELGMHTNQVRHVLGRQLEPIGEVFKAGENWVLTDAAISLKASPKLALERLKAELEQALFDGWDKLPERVRGMFEEFAASRNLPSPLTFEEAFKFAQRRALRMGVE